MSAAFGSAPRPFAGADELGPINPSAVFGGLDDSFDPTSTKWIFDFQNDDDDFDFASAVGYGIIILPSEKPPVLTSDAKLPSSSSPPSLLKICCRSPDPEELTQTSTLGPPAGSAIKPAAAGAATADEFGCDLNGAPIEARECGQLAGESEATLTGAIPSQSNESSCCAIV